ncbi:MAG: tetratricopeptide repeat protein [Deltaproteobacteria bacterium]|nr:tetratricopeptide repeat protein [Deltaproteobacteria bacterium]
MNARVLVAVVAALAWGTASAQPRPVPPPPRVVAVPAAPAFQHAALTGNPAAAQHVWQAVAAHFDSLPDVARRHLNEAIRLQPDMVIAHVLQSELAKKPEDKKQHLDAATSFAKTQKLLPWEKVWLQIAQLHYAGKPALALKQNEALVKANPNEPWFYVARGSAYLFLDTPPTTEKARIDYEKAVTLWPGCRAGWNMLGYTLIRQNKLQDALNALTRYVQLSPNLANPHDSLAEVLLRAKRLKEAEGEYKTALRLDPGFHDSRIGLGYTLVNIGLSLRGPNAGAHITQGLQELELAFAKSTEPHLKAMALRMMTVCHLLLQKPGQAAATLERYEQWARQHNDPEAVAAAQMFSAMVHAILGVYRHAYVKADEAAVSVQDPRVSPATKQRVLVQRAVTKALVLLELGEPAAAEAKLKEFAKAAAAAEWIKQTLGDLKGTGFVFRGDAKKAIALLAHANEDQPMALYYLGRAQLKAGDPGARGTLERLAASTVLNCHSGLWRFAAVETLRTMK